MGLPVEFNFDTNFVTFGDTGGHVLGVAAATDASTSTYQLQFD
jgi:hypothetical protein